MPSSGPMPVPAVLLLTFNRPHLTREVLHAIRPARPQLLFVASDGPRAHVERDAAAVAATRSLIDEMVDWPCDVRKRFSDVNQGCRVGVSSAITWFFEHVDEGIILEDDCVPGSDFFGYCAELLARYRNDVRIMSIAGDNSAQLRPSSRDVSYGFSRQPLIWGWATWRRAWEHYDADLEGWRSLREDARRQRSVWTDRIERRWQAQKLDRLLFAGEPDSWAYRWDFTLADRDGLSVTPAVNLVRNIGFGAGATHTSGDYDPRANVEALPILPLRHPDRVANDLALERQVFDRVHGGAAIRNPVRRGLRLFRRITGGLLRKVGVRRARRSQG